MIDKSVESTRSEGRLAVFASVPEQDFGSRSPGQLRELLCAAGFDRTDHIVIDLLGERIRITVIVKKESKSDRAYELAMITCLMRAKIIRAPEPASPFRAHAH